MIVAVYATIGFSFLLVMLWSFEKPPAKTFTFFQWHIGMLFAMWLWPLLAVYFVIMVVKIVKNLVREDREFREADARRRQILQEMTDDRNHQTH